MICQWPGGCDQDGRRLVDDGANKLYCCDYHANRVEQAAEVKKEATAARAANRSRDKDAQQSLAKQSALTQDELWGN